MKRLVGGTGQSQQLVLSEMHSLNNVSAVVENAANVLRVNSAREMRVTVVSPVGHCNFLNRTIMANILYFLIYNSAAHCG